MSGRIREGMRAANAARDKFAKAPHGKPVRFFAVGDPQTTCTRFLSVLDTHGLLSDDGWLRPDVGLVSMGDHFDFKAVDVKEAGDEGERILAWCAAHDADHVHLLFGNHDLARVMELAAMSDREFESAHAAAVVLTELVRREGATGRDAQRKLSEYRAMHAEAPLPNLVARDLSCFRASQRTLVQRLLVEKRFSAALFARLADTSPALLVHAGITTREIAMLEIDDDERVYARAVARALNRFVDDRVALVSEDWARGVDSKLDLSPLHASGTARQEGGGLFFHRPAHPSRDDAHRPMKGDRRRRFPVTDLPKDLVQVCGHVTHRKCREELAPHPLSNVDDGALRALVVERESVHYGPLEPRMGKTALVFTDGDMHRTPPSRYEILPLLTVERARVTP